jgi:Icc protein
MRHIAQNAGHLADFIVTTGDLVETPSDEGYATAVHLLGLQGALREVDAPGPQLVSYEGLSGFPMYFLPGNHDDRQNFYNNLSLRRPFSTSSQSSPLMNTKFQHKGIQFVCLDWGAENQAEASPQMLTFLTDALDQHTPSILLMHHPVVPIGVRWMDSLLAEGVGKFWEIVRGRRVLGIFCGHLHNTYDRKVEGIPVYGLRSTAPQFALQEEPLLCIQPPHYRVVHVEPEGLTTEIVEVAL